MLATLPHTASWLTALLRKTIYQESRIPRGPGNGVKIDYFRQHTRFSKKGDNPTSGGIPFLNLSMLSKHMNRT